MRSFPQESWSVVTTIIHWVLDNPIVVLTALLVIVTWRYTHIMGKTFNVLADEYLATIEPHLSATLTDGQPRGDEFSGVAVLTASHAPATLLGGYVQVTCRHGKTAGQTPLWHHEGHTLLPGNTLRITLMAKFDHDITVPLYCQPTLEAHVRYADTKKLGHYWLAVTADGKVRISGGRKGVGKLYIMRAKAQMQWFDFKLWLKEKFRRKRKT